MTAEHPPLNLLQRVDLALADRLAASAPPQPDELVSGVALAPMPEVASEEWVSGLLSLRGLVVSPEEVGAILTGRPCRFAPEHHEHRLVEGMGRVWEKVVRSEVPGPTDGWQIVELFKMFTEGVARFRNNCLRRDLPWDAILYVNYPSHEAVSGCLDGFHLPNHYTDVGQRFERLHPVRQAFRVLWLFARIAPFPDFNLTMSWIAMNLYLRHAGYPMLPTARQDRERLHRLVSGPVPQKIVAFEARMLERLQPEG